jgi:RhtB (resistance to homoserine/threonine) family protein
MTFTVLSIILIWTLGVMTPGPDFAMNLRQSISKGRKAGIFTSIGFGFGILLHCFYCILGLGVIITKSILLFNTIKILGGIYLIYLGWKSIVSKAGKDTSINFESAESESVLKSFQVGFLTDALNPKTTVLILSLFSQLFDQNTSIVWLLVTTVVFVLVTIFWHMLVSVMFTTNLVKQKYEKVKSKLNKIFGGILVLFGLHTITDIKF